MANGGVPSSIKPAVIIGIGGVGKGIILRIRRMIVEEYGGLENLPSIQFLHLDTYNNHGVEATQEISLHVLGQDISFKPNELVELSQNIPQQREDIRREPFIQEWFYPTLPINIDFSTGAGAVRAYGRLAFHYNVDKFEDALRKAAQNAQAGISKSNQTLNTILSPGLDVYVACSFFGGTGSGCFLDVCYQIRESLNQIQPEIMGFFIIGALNPDSAMCANSYAALKELEYFSTISNFNTGYPIPGQPRLVSSQLPVDTCYLFGAVNSNHHQFNRNELEENVAKNIFLEFSPGIGIEKRRKRVDIKASTAGYYSVDSSLHRAQSFFSQGLSIIEFPALQVKNILASNLAKEVCQYVSYNDAPIFRNLKEEVEKFLRVKQVRERDGLIKLLLSSGKDPIEDSRLNDLRRDKAELDGMINKKNFQAGNILAIIEKVINLTKSEAEDHPDPAKQGVLIKTIRGNKDGKFSELKKLIETEIAEKVSDKFIGLRNAKDLIDSAIQNLEKEKDSLISQRDSYETAIMIANKKIERRKDCLSDDLEPQFCWEVKYHVKQLLLKELLNYMRMRLKESAYNVASELVSEVVEELHNLQKQMETYERTLKGWTEEFDKDHKGRKENLCRRKNDEVVITEESLNGIAREKISDKKGVIDGIVFALENQNGKRTLIFPLVLGGRDKTKRVLIEECQKRFEAVKNTSVFTFLTNPSNLFIIKQREADVLLQLLSLDRTTGHIRELCHKRWIAFCGSDPNVQNSINQIPADYIQSPILPEPYRIIFAEEIGVFPLRCVAVVGDYKRSYDDLVRQDNTPRQSDRLIDFPDLLLPHPSIPGIYDRIERAIVMGRVFEFLKEQADPQTHYLAIFPHYMENGVKKKEKLCSSWEEIRNVLDRPQIEKALNRRQASTITPLERLEQEIERRAQEVPKEQILKNIKDYLEQLSKNLNGGKTHPEYEYQATIIKEFQDKLNIQD